MFSGLGKGLLLRFGAYALFLCGFWLLYKAFGFSDHRYGNWRRDMRRRGDFAGDVADSQLPAPSRHGNEKAGR